MISRDRFLPGSFKVVFYGLRLPEVRPGDDVAALIVEAAMGGGVGIEDHDVIAITSKVLSKALGLLINIEEVSPSPAALRLGEKTGVDPRVVEIVLRESDDIVAAIPFKRLVAKGIVPPDILSRSPQQLVRALDYYPTIFVTLRDHMLWTDSGLDTSNHPAGIYSIPPRNLDDHARRISERVRDLTGRRVAVVVCDTEMMPWGALDVARGAYGVPVITRRFGEPDSYGKPKFGGADAMANAVCTAAGLIMGQHGEGIPVVVARGLKYGWSTAGVKETLARIDTCRAVRETIKHTLRILGPAKLLALVKGRACRNRLERPGPRAGS